jgi:hypothetical protein
MDWRAGCAPVAAASMACASASVSDTPLVLCHKACTPVAAASMLASPTAIGGDVTPKQAAARAKTILKSRMLHVVCAPVAAA